MCRLYAVVLCKVLEFHEFALTSSKWQWLLAQDLHMIQPMDVVGAQKNLKFFVPLRVDRKGVVFLSEVATEKLPIPQ